jgi:protein-S-isoprenylcysteine O-methyltransferase Ste14
VSLPEWIETLGLWVLWWMPYLLIAPKVQKRESVTVAGSSRIGLVLVTLAIVVVWAIHVPGRRASSAAMIAALILGLIAAALMWTAVRHLGRQFRIQAGLYHDHQLVRTGPYALVRNPIYTSLFLMIIATGLVMTNWIVLVIASALYMIGTEIRVRAEERLLASRFGGEFEAYKRKVPAYLPFIR